MAPVFKIVKGVLDLIFEVARLAGRNEMMGILASARGSSVVSAAPLLPAAVSPGFAEADPMAIKACADDLKRLGLRPSGLFHSHAQGAVFHSATDLSTIARLLPPMATHTFSRFHREGLRVPVVCGQDEARVLLKDGQILRVTLRGAPIPALRAFERVAWEDVKTALGSGSGDPHVNFDGSSLSLTGGGIHVRLRVPEGATIHFERLDDALFRYAHLFSLVVNTKGDAFAECLKVFDFEGESLSRLEPCEIELVEDPRFARIDELNPVLMFERNDQARQSGA